MYRLESSLRPHYYHVNLPLIFSLILASQHTPPNVYFVGLCSTQLAILTQSMPQMRQRPLN
jgi:hypothetical protein